MSALEFIAASTVVASIIAFFVALALAAVKSFAATIPRQVWRWIISKFTLTVSFASHEPAYGMLRDWLAAHPYAKKARAVKMAYSPADGKFILVPGHGSHFFWYRGPLWIRYGEKKVDPKNEDSLGQEQYIVSMFAFHHSKMEQFMSELGQYKKQEVSSLHVYTWRGGYWNWFGAKRKRSLDTVYMSASTKNEIIAAIKNFLASEEWYAARGIPWRMGILLEGGPGTGKTTVASALAGFFDRALYSMNLNSVNNDESLLYAFSSAGRNGFVLIEDVDGFEAAQDRGNIEVEASPSTAGSSEPDQEETESNKAPKAPKGEKKDRVTISGLLNAVDGVAASEGRILILTTNDVSKLDPALLRSGRIDHKFHIGHLTPSDVVDMFKCFYPGSDCFHARIRKYASSHSTTAAAWQKLFIKYHDSVERLFSEAIDV